MPPNLIAVGTYSLLAEAHLAKHALDAEGIHSTLRNEFLIGTGEAEAAMELSVPAKDVDRARAILTGLRDGAEARLAKGETIPCPECRSTSTKVLWQPPKGYFKWLLSAMTHNMHRVKLQCSKCGNEWDTRW